MFHGLRVQYISQIQVSSIISEQWRRRMEAIWNSGTSWVIYLQNLGSWLKTPMEAFSFLGTENFFLVLLPALYWCVETGIGLRIGIILLLSTSVNDGLKMAFRGPRPYW